MDLGGIGALRSRPVQRHWLSVVLVSVPARISDSNNHARDIGRWTGEEDWDTAVSVKALASKGINAYAKRAAR